MAFKQILFRYLDSSSLLCVKMACFHVYTKGLVDRELFICREDYIAGMNIVAIVCSSIGVELRLLAFVLMSNHLHFVLDCSKDKAERFIWLYKHLLSRYLGDKYGYVKYLRGLETTVSEVSPGLEDLRRLIAYVLNNPVKAGIDCIACAYEWSSARCYFSATDFNVAAVPLQSYTVRQLRSLLHTRKTLPGNWLLGPAGYILPQSYVDKAFVEELFKSSRSFEYFLSSSLSMKKGVNENITFSDAVIRSSMNELLEKKFGISSVSELDEFLLKNLIKDLKVRFSASSKQLARITGVGISDIIKYLE